MNDQETPNRGWRWKVGLPVLLLLLLGIGWYCWPDGRVNTAKKLRSELADKSLTAEQRQQKFRELRKTMEKMTPTQREALAAEDRKRRTVEMGKYFRMSPAEKARYLDERIKRMNQMSQGKQGGPGGAGGNRGGPPGGGAGSGQGKGPSGGDQRSSEARDSRRQNRLDGSTPAERAMFTQFMSDLSARRRQLGMQGGMGPRR